MSKHFIPSYLVRNRFGVYYFQRRIPKSHKLKFPNSPTFVRISLRTKELKVAKRIMRRLVADWDKRAQSYFNCEDDFHRAQKLLERYKSYLASNLPYSTIEEEFFAELDDTSDYESALLDSAVRLFNSRLLDQGIDVHSASSIALPTNFNQKNVFRTQLQITEVPLSKAHNDFLTLQRTNWKSESNSEKSHLEAFNLLLGLTGDINTSELTKEHITNLAKIIINYPSNKNKKAKYRNLKVSDFLSFTTPEADKIKPNTINKHKSHIVLFLKYLKQNDYCQVELHTP